MKNFLITAIGRSGTKFLSQTMNQSRIWIVRHEPETSNDLNSDISHIQKRFDRDYYGEVNSYLRYKADDIRVAKKGIILRDPAEIWLSIANRHPKKQWGADIKDLEKSIIKLLCYSMKKEYKVILFRKMVGDKSYLDSTIKYFGIQDVEITNEILNTKINANKKEKHSSMKEFSSEIQDVVYDLKHKTDIIGGLEF